MSKVSNIISSYVVSIYNGQLEGIVSNILFNNKKQAKYLVISQNDETFLTLETKDIYRIGDGAVLIKNSDVLELMESTELKIKDYFSPINSLVISTSGNLLGNVSDIELDYRYNIQDFFVKDKAFSLVDIANISESVIIVNDEEKRLHIARFKSKQKIKLSDSIIQNQTVNILDNQTILPNRTIVNYNFLVGRKVSKDIANFNGEIIIKENQIINTKILDIARINGKIRELTKNSI